MAALGLIALIAVVPAGRMPRFSDEELPVGYPEAEDPDLDPGREPAED
jgi:hypothetical protein